ncbi:hypothetical protein [Billgrantia kenyensis]|uniref:Uncharacterized protein n=1 Tax=Billgrantia kenyensis TaxID=321266 RepID=A0A7V9VYH3_9GAMM|nr:hypothetical protein [Halomonas kenyensis]MBA2777739.1 hypothetical protein [Halomonas kenyensis]MCG6660409.1 hypothetical protein [Halomonas kenyensis]
MTTLQFHTIWDLPLVSRRDAAPEQPGTAPITERFLTIWDNPNPRRDEPASKRASRKLTKFYI